MSPTDLAAQVDALAAEVSDDADRRQQTRGRQRSAGRRMSRQAWVIAALAVTVPVFGLCLTAAINGRSIGHYLASAPSPAEAKAQADAAMAFTIGEIDGYVEDYTRLPEQLEEIAAPPVGDWRYTRHDGAQYQLVLTVGSATVRFDSRSRLPEQP